MNKKQYITPKVHTYQIHGYANILFSSGKEGSFSNESKSSYFIYDKEEEEDL